MRASKLISLLIAVLILTGTLGVAGVMAEDQAAAQPGAPSGNSTDDMPSNDTTIVPGNNSTIQPPDNIVVPAPVPDNATSPAANTTLLPLTLVLENHTYYPNDTVRAFVYNVTDPLINVIDPSGAIYDIDAVRLNDSAFMGEYVLNRSIILANYTVIVTDNVTGVTVNDTFEVTTRPVIVTPVPNATITPDNGTTVNQPFYLFLNLSQNEYTPPDNVDITVITNAGTPTAVIQDPMGNTAHVDLTKLRDNAYEGTYKLDKAVILGNYTMLAYVNENGTYNYTMAYFNVSMNKSTAPPDTLNIKYTAYDPARKAIALRVDVNASSVDDIDRIVENFSVVSGLAIKDVHIIPAGDNKRSLKNFNKEVEVLIPVDNNNSDYIARRLNLSRDIVNATTSVTTSLNGEEIRISLNNKSDGNWYRMSASVPEGYTVTRIVRSDGKEVKNNIEINNSTGEIINYDINWYVDNSSLYFYDDPTSIYTVSLSPLSVNPTTVTLYFHDNGTQYLNTSSSNSTNTQTDMSSSNSITWTQSQAFTSDFIIQSNPSVNLYLTSKDTSQTKIDVLMYYTDGTNNILIYANNGFKFTGSTSPMLVSISINVNNFVVPAGNKIQITIVNRNNKINTIFESTQYPSSFSTTSTSYINVSNVTVYDALNNQVNGITAPSTINVVANVSDPFGIQDISNVALTIYYENGTAAIGPLVMNLNNTTIPPSNAWALYESNIPINANQIGGNYTIMVTATSLDGITDTNSTVLTIVPINVIASKSITLQDGNNFTITINVTNNNAYTVYGIHAYDFYAGDFNVGSFSQPRSTVPVNNGILQGNINVFGPFNLAPYQKITINYIAQGIGDYKLSNMTIVGVDPYV
jgi:hypothetical protein